SSRPDEKESYLEAAESLQQKGIIKLSWEKRGRGERLKTLSCENFEKLFEEAGRPYPKTEAEKIRAMLGEKVQSLKGSLAMPARDVDQAEKTIAFLEFLSLRFGPREIGQGIVLSVVEEFIRLLEFCSDTARREQLTTRALSILLYRDSKRLENLLTLCGPLLLRAQKISAVPDLAFLERSYPETMIAGKIIIQYKNQPPMVNSGGHILGLPLESAQEIESIQLVSDKKEKTVLTIENKETFYALGSPQKHGSDLSRYDCFLYIGGYSNRAAAALVKTLSASGFSFYHAGDLDPDGVLILQHIQDIAQKPVIPVRMDAATFDQYRPWARTLTKPMLRQIEKIREETKTISELAGLLRRIEETGLGVEQEIVDYRI
ncbi:MAG: DUF2220 domain-containing protein, partial [Treponema sp.]|nr:DUF2220 domain-containing protein [Treponema sp.]